ncbi:PREDICTED: inactive hydroxysteroid dehydrogenase-like protein 1 [Priapulus caudatus]|uniref:Inactive hydroxysteroid dehydrogenase-like protein 1 n=1 Tax=Priapulus caudatus TaxID=37621 RepID=A0ABM1EE47_PRICU|nr:PREDICTED: inactive hydroxysteroid dehydrogenase-like protein 1 [Priapulus caudatus]
MALLKLLRGACIYIYVDIPCKYKSTLALVGAAYVSYMVLKVSYYSINFVRTHLLYRIRPNNLRRFGDWAAVTGCTSGIGREYATELARQGFNLVLLNRPGRLDRVAQSIEETYDVRVIVIKADFSRGPGVYEEIAAQLRHLEVDVLVNNVGVMYDYPMPFADVPANKLWELVNVNVAAATMMTHLLLPGMLARRRGAVVNVASASAYMPTPHVAVYSATKSYVDFLSRALRHECRGSGVVVQTLVPFYVATRMTRYAESIARPCLTIPSACDFAVGAARTLGVAAHTTGYWCHSLQLMICWLVPEWLWMWGATMLNLGLRRQAHRRMMSKQHSSGGSVDGPWASPTHKPGKLAKSIVSHSEPSTHSGQHDRADPIRAASENDSVFLESSQY